MIKSLHIADASTSEMRLLQTATLIAGRGIDGDRYCSGCGTYPTTPITFTDNKLYQGGKLITVPGAMWGVNLKPAAKLECKEATTVAANGDTTISFV